MDGDLKIVSDIDQINAINVTIDCPDVSLSDTELVIDKYKNDIKEFFSIDGEGNGIKEIYSKLKLKDACDRVINDIDINKAAHTYPEYLNGMMSFINDIIANTNEETNGDFTDKIETAAARDAEFIQSLFGGENNQEKTCSIDECFQNVEFLIDFIPMMDELKNDCEVLKTAIGGKELSDVAKKSIALFCKSVKAFVYESLTHMVQSYAKVKHCLFACDELENKTPKYQLF